MLTFATDMLLPNGTNDLNQPTPVVIENSIFGLKMNHSHVPHSLFGTVDFQKSIQTSKHHLSTWQLL